MDNYREYIEVEGEYGVVQFCPLFIADITITKLERWFQNNKLIHLAFDKFHDDDYLSENLQVEFVYHHRVFSNREAIDIKQDVLNQTNAKQYQLLINIVHQSFEMLYECYELFNTEKTGESIIDFKKSVQEKVKRFEKNNFPDKANKIREFGKSEELIRFIEEMNAARNCIEHRDGIVDKDKDLKGKTKLSMHWKAPIIHSQEGQISVTSNVKGRFNGALSFDQGVLEFQEGELIKISFEDNYKFIYTIIFALKTIIDGLYEKNGINQNKTPEIRKIFRT